MRDIDVNCKQELKKKSGQWREVIPHIALPRSSRPRRETLTSASRTRQMRFRETAAAALASNRNLFYYFAGGGGTGGVAV